MSTIMEREMNLLKAMHNQGFQPFFEGNHKDAMETLTSSMESMVNYQNSVIMMETQIPIIRFTCNDTADYQAKVEDLDRTRRIRHESAITNVNILNRICDAYGVEPIAPIDTKDRYAVAEFIGEFCNEMYQRGISDSHQTQKTLDKTVIKERIAELDAKFSHLSPGDDETEYTM